MCQVYTMTSEIFEKIGKLLPKYKWKFLRGASLAIVSKFPKFKRLRRTNRPNGIHASAQGAGHLLCEGLCAVT